ncbi:MAG: cobalt ECF transporter T component CbiQ [Desulfuromonadaceae bacterium GWC2_58_13]|nr:MAG: cobalt ECF transporter T component CbiQ [Desulfuromonadaceae bacterium GWC2_58_13]
MAKIESSLFDLGALDTLAGRQSAVHRLDPRAKLVTTLFFVCTVVSFGKYEISALLPFVLFPLVLVLVADLPAGMLLKKLLLAAPFAFFIGVFNPLLDRQILLHLGSLEISGGWISFISILLRFALTVFAALILIATTSFTGVCMAMERLGAPRIFALQLLFLYRYLFVLIDEAARMARARALRSFHGRGMGLKVAGNMAGQLLLRTLDRAQRIHQAMLCRGFDGEIRMLRPLHIGRREVLFTLGWSALFLLLRFVNLPQLLGGFLTELIR